MANTNATYQQVNTVSVRREKLIDIASDTGYGKNDLRVFLALLTQLEGFTPPKNNREYKDPLNFKIIDIKAISDTLDISKKKVKKIIEKLHDDGLLEEGGNDTIKSGYRFTF